MSKVGFYMGKGICINTFSFNWWRQLSTKDYLRKKKKLLKRRTKKNLQKYINFSVLLPPTITHKHTCSPFGDQPGILYRICCNQGNKIVSLYQLPGPKKKKKITVMVNVSL